MTDEALTIAINSIKSGDVKRGRKLLDEILKRDPNNEAALLWMTQAVTDTPSRLESAFARFATTRIGPVKTPFAPEG